MVDSRVQRIAAGTALALALTGAACSQQADNNVSTGGNNAAPTTAAPNPTTEGGGGVGESLGGLTPAASAQYLSKAAEKTADRTTGTFTMTMGMTGTPGSTGGTAMFTVDGAFDTAAKRARMTMDLGGLLDGFGGAGGSASGSGSAGGLGKMLGEAFAAPVDVVVDGQTAYLRWPFLAQMAGASTPWVSFDGSQAGGTSANPLGTASGDAYLQLLRDAGQEVTEVGQETIDGVTTTHYHTTIDLKALAGKARDEVPADQRAQLDQALSQFSGTAELPVDVWIGDEDNQVRRIQMALDFSQFGGLDGLGAAGAGKLSGVGMTMTVDFHDLGAPVDIAVPPADQVTAVDESSLGGGLVGGLGKGRSGTRSGRSAPTTTAN